MANQWPQICWLLTYGAGEDTTPLFDGLKIADDVSGFVGGYLKNGRRNNASVVNRCLVCLDADSADPELLDDLDLTFPNAYAFYSTHSHTPERMRLRNIIPLARAVTPDEYAAISRRLADNLTLTRVDPTTFESVRLMY